MDIQSFGFLAADITVPKKLININLHNFFPLGPDIQSVAMMNEIRSFESKHSFDILILHCSSVDSWKQTSRAHSDLINNNTKRIKEEEKNSPEMNKL